MPRLTNIDLLRGIAAFLIVGVHVVFPQRTSAAWLLHDYCDVGVAIFAALSGFFMPGDKYVPAYKEYLRGRIQRLLIPYVIFSLLYIILSIISQHFSGGIKGKYATLDYWFHVFFDGNASTHLWFLIWLFYFQVALVKILPRLHVLLVWSLGLVGVFVCCWKPGISFVEYPLRLLSFLLLGYGLKVIVRFRGHWRLGCVGAGVAIVAWIGFGLFTGELPVRYRDLMVVMTTITASVLLEVEWTGSAYRHMCSFLGMTSMGVYLLHPSLSVTISRLYGHLAPPPHGISAVCCSWVLSYGLCLALVYAFYGVKRRWK